MQIEIRFVMDRKLVKWRSLGAVIRDFLDTVVTQGSLTLGQEGGHCLRFYRWVIKRYFQNDCFVVKII